jgi:bifunctional DNA-binding transcriptional regulator/antitoxin component of YhaV-PrlF toxin-antitoxin module
MVLPKDVRKALGIEGETKMTCGVIGNKVVLENYSGEAIRKAFAELGDIAPSLEVDTVNVEGEDEYVDREYVLCKIGIRGVG